MSNKAHVESARPFGELSLPALYGEVAGWWQNEIVRTVVKVVFLVGMGAMAALAKKVGLPLGIPGSNGILWVAPLVAGYIFVKKPGAGVLMGTSTALWGVAFGINHELVFNLCEYGIAGLALDVAVAIPFVNIRNPFGAVFCGAFAHMAKFAFITEAGLLSGVTKNFMVFGLGRSALLHLVFGVVAGLFAWVVYDAANSRNRKQGKELPSATST